MLILCCRLCHRSDNQPCVLIEIWTFSRGFRAPWAPRARSVSGKRRGIGRSGKTRGEGARRIRGPRGSTGSRNTGARAHLGVRAMISYSHRELSLSGGSGGARAIRQGEQPSAQSKGSLHHISLGVGPEAGRRTAFGRLLHPPFPPR